MSMLEDEDELQEVVAVIECQVVVEGQEALMLMVLMMRLLQKVLL